MSNKDEKTSKGRPVKNDTPKERGCDESKTTFDAKMKKLTQKIEDDNRALDEAAQSMEEDERSLKRAAKQAIEAARRK